VSVADLGFIHTFQAPADPSAPTLLLLHGTGGDERDLLPLGRAVAPDAGLISPRGKVREHGMPRFFRRLAEGVFDIDDLRLRTHELADFVSAAADHYGFDHRLVTALGFSNGANIAASLLLLRPETLTAAILFRAMVPLVPESMLSLPRTPVLLSGGRLDPIVPAAETERLAELLRTAGADVTLHWEPAGHQLTQGDVTLAKAWIERSVSGTSKRRVPGTRDA
jgi:predicted esterase